MNRSAPRALQPLMYDCVYGCPAHKRCVHLHQLHLPRTILAAYGQRGRPRPSQNHSVPRPVSKAANGQRKRLEVHRATRIQSPQEIQPQKYDGKYRPIDLRLRGFAWAMCQTWAALAPCLDTTQIANVPNEDQVNLIRNFSLQHEVPVCLSTMWDSGDGGGPTDCTGSEAPVTPRQSCFLCVRK